MSWFNIKIPGVTFCLNDVEGERTLDNCTVMVNQQNVLVWCRREWCTLHLIYDVRFKRIVLHTLFCKIVFHKKEWNKMAEKLYEEHCWLIFDLKKFY